MRTLGIDFGEARIGLAISDDLSLCNQEKGEIRHSVAARLRLQNITSPK